MNASKTMKKWKRRAKKFKRRFRWYGERVKLLNYIIFFKKEEAVYEHYLTAAIISALYITYVGALFGIVLVSKLNYVALLDSWCKVNFTISLIPAIYIGWNNATEDSVESKKIYKSDLEDLF